MNTRIIPIIAAVVWPISVFAAPSDPCFADMWKANISSLKGKTVKTFIQSIEDVEGVASDAPCVVLNVSTGNAKGASGGEILVLVPIQKASDFIAGAFAPDFNKPGKSTTFGSQSKSNSKETSAIFTVIEGEPVLVSGDTPDLGGKKPSELYAAQKGIQKSPPKKDAPKK